jgi:hypothetical protein
MMKKDLTSYEKHDSEFNTELNSVQKTLEIIKLYDEVNQFKLLGFEHSIRMSNPLPKTHIDIGSGNGWLVRKTSPLFEKVIGIEPSAQGVSLAKEINKENKNVYFINKDMIDGLQELASQEPVFITTATVLSHIEDFYVEDFLREVNKLPILSTLCFDERYDKNIHWKMWHVRSKEWWETRLPNWQLYFLNLENNNYSSSFFGVCLGKENVLKTHRMGRVAKIFWKISKLYYIFERILQKCLKLLKK